MARTPRTIKVGSITYRSILDAAKAFGISAVSMKSRASSPTYPEVTMEGVEKKVSKTPGRKRRTVAEANVDKKPKFEDGYEYYEKKDGKWKQIKIRTRSPNGIKKDKKG